jgi:ribonuclease D
MKSPNGLAHRSGATDDRPVRIEDTRSLTSDRLSEFHAPGNKDINISLCGLEPDKFEPLAPIAAFFLRLCRQRVKAGHGLFLKESRSAMTIRLHQGDIPHAIPTGSIVAIDTETLGLNPHRDRLCLVQLSTGNGEVDIVQIGIGQSAAPNLVSMLADPGILKLFHFARFDLAVLAHAFGVMSSPVYCTKIASKLTRTYTDRHGLKEIARELLNVDLSKQQQSSDWGAPLLSEAQLAYAASDVLYLHALKIKFDTLLLREGRMKLAEACFKFLPSRAELDLSGWPEADLFAHS